MGADLIGYMVVGPVRLDEARRAAAAERVIAFFKATRAWRAADAADDAFDVKAHPDLADVDEPDSVDSVGWTPADESNDAAAANELIDDLFAVWAGRPRDCSTRTIDDGARRVVFCGELSWGDEPEGYGYQTCKRVSQAGLFKVFDVY